MASLTTMLENKHVIIHTLAPMAFRDKSGSGMVLPMSDFDCEVTQVVYASAEAETPLGLAVTFNRADGARTKGMVLWQHITYWEYAEAERIVKASQIPPPEGAG